MSHLAWGGVVEHLQCGVRRRCMNEVIGKNLLCNKLVGVASFVMIIISNIHNNNNALCYFE